MNDELPEGWASTTLDQLLPAGGLFDGPFGSSLKTSDYAGRGVRVIRLENIANLRFVAEKETWVTKAKFEELMRHEVREGDIIFGSFVDDTVRVCILPKLPTPAIAKADCFCIRPMGELVDRKFLLYQLGSSSTRTALVEEIHGATRPRINTGQLRALDVVLPPLAEQRRIVAKVEALLARVNAARERLEKVPRLLKRLRQSVLAKAFRGELVPTEAELATREGRSYQSAAQLLGKRGDFEADADLPKGWASTLMSEVAEIRGGIQKQPKRMPKANASPYLRVANVLRGRLDLREIQKMELFGEELDQYRLCPGDLLVVEGNGSLSEIGRSALWGGEIADCVHQNHIIRVRPRGSLPKFLDYFWNSPLGQEQISSLAVTTAGLYSLSTKKVANVVVPIAPIAEQSRIVAKVDSLLGFANSLEVTLDGARAVLEGGPQSILQKAFAGELVPTEAELAVAEGRAFESAEELLRRVTSDRAGGTPAQPKDIRVKARARPPRVAAGSV